MQIDTKLVATLIADQFPQWRDLPVRPVARDGHDNRSFHLGDAMIVRLPSAAGYAPGILKEGTWLPRLAPHLSLPIPVPVAVGEPCEAYPWAWSVCPYLGETASPGGIGDRVRFAADLAGFLRALQAAPCQGGPAAGAHNFYRGGPLQVYDGETRRAIDAAADLGLAAPERLTAIWERALTSAWNADPVWVHGDVALGNLIVADGRLSAVIDFGMLGTGDPACDLVMAYTFFAGASRAAFMAGFGFGIDVWRRAQGWALWKALITLACEPAADTPAAREAVRVVRTLVCDFL